ncbi:MAG TPA: glutamate--tRNA ligase [Candidatus Hydrogenedentes bacterium]|nr:glutamate--tRNA ligase [Candidatus Hydrogenedentota bacterium]
MSMVRVRIAPAPSGFLHIGTAKTALFNWLFARHTGGTFILRLEDTDAERTDEAYVAAMCAGFKWLGIDWDEGPPFGGEPEKGDYGPYRQSQRRDLYRSAVTRLLDEGKAYKCFCTREELDAEREKARAAKGPLKYSGKCRNLAAADVAAKGDAPYAVRFKVPEGRTEVHDLVQGVVRTDNAEFDDFIIQKPNGDAVFHLAVVVDDGSMGITHVIRGDDHLTNAARHVMLFNALGYDLPQFAHLPMVLDERGKKYSKRDRGANVLDWRDDGYLPEALVNYVALLGWTPAEDREVYARAELIDAFRIDRLGKSAAKFDLKKLQWLNGQHIRRLRVEALRDRLVPILERAGYDTASRPEAWLTQMTAICQEKLATLNDIVDRTDFFFAEPTKYEDKAVRKQWQSEDALDRMAAIRRILETVEAWSAEALKAEFERECAALRIGLGKLIHPARLALTGKSVGPGLFELTILLGRETCLVRIDKAIKYIQNLPEVEG